MRLTQDDIIWAVCKFYKLDRELLLGPTQLHPVAHPRQAAFALIRELTEATPAAIGRKFNRNHSTIFHGVKNHNQRCRDQESVAHDYARIATKLGAYKDRLCYCAAYEQAWNTWAFIHRPQFMDRSSPLRSEQRPAP